MQLTVNKLTELLRHSVYRTHKGGGCTPCEQIQELVGKGTTDVIVSKSEYESLKEDSVWLAYLNAAGVDNWQGVDFAVELRDNDRDIKEKN